MAATIILGAGISGISASYHLGLKGIKSIIFEKDDDWAGLCGNFKIDGFRFDKAIHLSFTKNAYVQELFSKSDVVSIEKGLGEISVIYGAEVANTPGVFAAVSGEYALSNISLVDAVICGNEHIFIVNEDDLMKALEAMHRIRKWGEKVKG